MTEREAWIEQQCSQHPDIDSCTLAIMLRDAMAFADATREAGGDAMLAAFGRWCLDSFMNDGEFGDIDGASVQEKAVEIGVLVPTVMTEPCGERCICFEVSEGPHTCYRLHSSLHTMTTPDVRLREALEKFVKRDGHIGIEPYDPTTNQWAVAVQKRDGEVIADFYQKEDAEAFVAVMQYIQAHAALASQPRVLVDEKPERRTT